MANIDYDRWGRPLETFRRGGGDCDDLAIVAASFCRAMGVPMYVVVGLMCQGLACDGHAWIEGQDEGGWFLLEATSGQLTRGGLPGGYQRHFLLTPESCSDVAEYGGREALRTVARINAAVEMARWDALQLSALGIAS
jgi:transglutaminase-like putative cysteine protease